MLHIKDILDPDFDWNGIEITEDEFDALSMELVIDYLKKHGPKERQMLALCWNFDNSKEVIRWIVDQPDTDKGTILLLYWYMQPGFYKKFADREECEAEASWALEDYDIIETIEIITFLAFMEIKDMLLILQTMNIAIIMIGSLSMRKKKQK